MTLPDKPQDLLPLSDARWAAALGKALQVWGSTYTLEEWLRNEPSGRFVRRVAAIARLLILANQVPEPVDPVDEAWKRFHEERRKGGQIRATLEKHFHVTPKGDA